MSNNELYVGLISGTSADGIDAALVSFQQDESHRDSCQDSFQERPQLLAHHSHNFTAEQKSAIRKLMLPGDNEIDQLGVLDQQLGHAFAQATLELLKQANVRPEQISAIGSHGQTLRHRPPGELDAAFTLQIGDPNIIAQETGITTVADMRRRDMAAGGQGAPLAPAIHNAVFRSNAIERFIVNIGGIGNITQLPINSSALGFDTGPGNCLMDEWIQLHQQQGYDRGGQWASGGQVHQPLLEALLQHPYFNKRPPKSTGREEFHLPWLQTVLDRFEQVAAIDVQSTLAELTVQSIGADILKLATDEAIEVFVCGGGAHNHYLMQRLGEYLATHKTGSKLGTTTELGIAPDWVEAAAFAWMAKRTLHRKPGNLASVTGAKAGVILGGIYFAG